MVRHFFLDKAATIVKGINENTGLNPVISLSYGDTISRALISFDVEKIITWIDENTFDINKAKFVVHLTNKNNSDIIQSNNEYLSLLLDGERKDFDLEFFNVNKPFDQGRGYDYDEYGKFFSQSATSTNGVTWYNARNDEEWDVPGAYNEDVNEVIGTQHFNEGTEDINFDITDFLIRKINQKTANNTKLGGMFYGIGIKYTKEFEENTSESKIVEFYTNSTNLFFKPYIKAIYEETINDDRNNFNTNNDNSLYLYVSDGEKYVNLDNAPTCSLGDVEQIKTGVYKTTIEKGKLSSCTNKINYDVWGDLLLNGKQLDDVEQEFYVSNPQLTSFNTFSFNDGEKPSVYGINDSEELLSTDIRTVFVDFRRKYGSEIKKFGIKTEYRIYIKYGNKEYTVFDYLPIDVTLDSNYFCVYAEDLNPGKYFVDLRVKNGRSEKVFKDVLHFNVSSKYIEQPYSEYVNLTNEIVRYLSAADLNYAQFQEWIDYLSVENRNYAQFQEWIDYLSVENRNYAQFQEWIDYLSVENRNYAQFQEWIDYLSVENAQYQQKIYEQGLISKSNLEYTQKWQWARFLSLDNLRHWSNKNLINILSDNNLNYTQNQEWIELTSKPFVVQYLKEHVDILSDNYVEQRFYEWIDYLSHTNVQQTYYEWIEFVSNELVHSDVFESVAFLSNSKYSYSQQQEWATYLSNASLDQVYYEWIEFISQKLLDATNGEHVDFLSSANPFFNKQEWINFLSNDLLSSDMFNNIAFLSTGNLTYNTPINWIELLSNDLLSSDMFNNIAFLSTGNLTYNTPINWIELLSNELVKSEVFEAINLLSNKDAQSSKFETISLVSNILLSSTTYNFVKYLSLSNLSKTQKPSVLGIKWLTTEQSAVLESVELNSIANLLYAQSPSVKGIKWLTTERDTELPYGTIKWITTVNQWPNESARLLSKFKSSYDKAQEYIEFKSNDLLKYVQEKLGYIKWLTTNNEYTNVLVSLRSKYNLSYDVTNSIGLRSKSAYTYTQDKQNVSLLSNAAKTYTQARLGFIKWITDIENGNSGKTYDAIYSAASKSMTSSTNTYRYDVLYGSTSTTASGKYLKNGVSYEFSCDSSTLTSGTAKTYQVSVYTWVPSGTSTNVASRMTLPISTTKQSVIFSVPSTGYWSFIIYNGNYASTSGNVITFKNLVLRQATINVSDEKCGFQSLRNVDYSQKEQNVKALSNNSISTSSLKQETISLVSNNTLSASLKWPDVVIKSKSAYTYAQNKQNVALRSVSASTYKYPTIRGIKWITTDYTVIQQAQ